MKYQNNAVLTRSSVLGSEAMETWHRIGIYRKALL